MRLLCVLLLLAPALAAETPAESFRAFMAAVMAEDKSEAERRKAFERYFDFETWVTNRQAAEEAEYTAEEKKELKEQWFTLFLSAEFRDTYRTRDVKIIEEPKPQGDTAELVVTMKEEGAEQPGRFRVLMTKSGDHWRWHSVPRELKPEAPLTPAQKLAAVKQAIEELRAQAQQIGRRINELESERKKLEAEIAEAGANEAPYSSPLTTARTLGKAVQAGDADAVLRAHTAARREVDGAKFTAKLKRESERLATWEPLDSTLGEDGATASVRVRIKLWASHGVNLRTITIALRTVGDEWLVDEAP